MQRITLKTGGVTLTLALVLLRRSSCGVILEGHEDRHVSVASSFVQFHGPVAGPEYEVKVAYGADHQGDELQDQLVHEHEDRGQHALDYVAHPRYQFSYGVEDHHTGDFHAQKESRDGSVVSGEYSVKEPGGGVRVVSYRADKDGFHAVVHTSGKNDHSPGAYGGAVRDEVQVQGHEVAAQQDHSIRDYEAEGY